MTLDAANLRQNQAADPSASTWLSANAGSGKTRVLTDRVARLLLKQVPPQNILCLTYTKAAASEMQNRLFQRLGDWAMTGDAELQDALAKLGIEELGDRETLARARRLFARAIETPGGLRIQTIHSFCASLLRRFPLEAGVSPAFAEMDERAAALLRHEIVEELAEGDGAAAVEAVAGDYTGESLADLTTEVVRHRQALFPPAAPAEIWAWFDLPPGFDAAALLSEAFKADDAKLIGQVVAALRKSSKPTDLNLADRLSGLDFADPDIGVLDGACNLFIYGQATKAPGSAKTDRLPTKEGKELLGPLLEPFHELMRRFEPVFDKRRRQLAARKTAALHFFAGAFLPAYEARKARRGSLDFDDLIQRSLALLTDPAVSSWVLYRLDGGLDHILVDEAQDTSPTQWQVIERLAQEFTSGKGARDGTPRTIFVVGDQKQSIYSFQGADPAAFEYMKQHFAAKLEPIGDGLKPMELEYSFRSADAILRFVEHVFRERNSPGVVMNSSHRAFHSDFPGRVDIWPAVPPAEDSEPAHWTDPVDMPGADKEHVLLARALANRMDEMIGKETIPLPNGARRTVRAGDFLILVRSRSELFAEIIRACKAKGLPIAGADRLKLGGELAVRDLAALLQFLATPEDDLSLATALRSPLFGWAEAALFDLAAGRGDIFLWQALRDAADTASETLEIIGDLRDQSDFLRPYDLIERILTRHDGRRKLLARLGPEAEDGIDSLLSQALAYEHAEIPSLTGFLTWLETDDVEVKRQLDSAGDQIRVMTVHGAKGLESPIVILPDTKKWTPRLRDEVLRLGENRAVWKVKADQRPELMQSVASEMTEAQRQENLRLYYVAITRAETWLILCAAGETGDGDDSWHAMAEPALTELGAVPLQTPVGPGLRYQLGDWAAGKMVESPEQEKIPAALPVWAERPAPRPEKANLVLSPSDLGGAKALPGAGGQDEDAALALGRQVHRLLEHLPDLPEDQWPDAAGAILGDADDTLPNVTLALGQASRVLSAPDLFWLFQGDALVECDLTAFVPGLEGMRVHGAIDRLLIRPDRVLAVDFKTNAVIPGTPEATPDGILRQMGAYLEALEAIFPDRAVEVAILWTSEPRYMPLPHEIVRDALRATPTS